MATAGAMPGSAARRNRKGTKSALDRAFAPRACARSSYTGSVSVFSALRKMQRLQRYIAWQKAHPWEPRPRLSGAEYSRRYARQGGLARQAMLTPEQRRELGRRGAAVRWARYRAAQAANSPSAR